MSDLKNFLKQRHRSRLASTVDRLNCRLRRVCSLLHEPKSVAAPPRLHLHSVADVHRSIDRRLRLQYARSLQELCAIHEQHRLAFAVGDIDPVEHERLEMLFDTWSRGLARR